jgi:hypothetical protein
MREQIERRLHDLTAEFKAGQEMLADMDERRANLSMTMARISGAIQVLEELLGAQSGDSSSSPSACGDEREAVA